jgi:hypothetical protein
MDERDYLSGLLGGSFHNRYVMPPLNFDPSPPRVLAPPAITPPNVIIPTTGAAKYWYVDPRATVQPVLPDATDERTGIVPVGQNPQVSNIPIQGVRLADDRSDLLRDTDNIFYGGGQAPAPTSTPRPTPVPPKVISRFIDEQQLA